MMGNWESSAKYFNELLTDWLTYWLNDGLICFDCRLKKRLLEVSDIIAERNKSRPFPYPYLDPKEVPNAISI